MTSKYEIENFLRPPVELQSALVSILFSVLCVLAPSKFAMSPTVGYSFAFAFFISAAHRFYQGISILRYQRSLVKLPRYVMSLSKIKASNNYLFLGKGFRWREIHTERLYAARERKNERYVKPSALYQFARHIEYKVENSKFKFLGKLLAKDVFFNPFRPHPDVGGDSCLHGVGIMEETEITMRLSNRYGHHIVAGSTRVGKSRKAETYISQDIRRNKDDLIIVFDPKGDSNLLKRVYLEAKAAGRLSELMIFHLGFPEMSCCYNPLDSFTRITELSTRITGGLSENGNAKAFKDFAWQFTNVFSKSLFYCGETPNYHSIKAAFKKPELVLIKYVERYLSLQNIEYKSQLDSILNDLKSKKTKNGSRKSIKSDAFCQLIIDLEITDNTLDDLLYIYNLSEDYFAKISSAIGPFLEKVTTGKIGEIISGNAKDKTKPFLDWLDLYKRGGIVYIGLDALTDTEVASAFGEAAFSGLTSLAGYLYKHDINAGTPFSENIKRNVIIHGDELSDLIGPKFVPLANKSGGANFQLLLYTQSLVDLEVKLGNEAKANQVITNINTIELMRIQDEKTANIMIKKLPEVNVSTIMAVSGVNDNPGKEQSSSVGFVSSNEDRTSSQRVPMLQVADIAGLPKGQSFCLKEGNTLYKLRSAMPSVKDNESLPDSFNEMLINMRDAYKSNIQWQKED